MSCGWMPSMTKDRTLALFFAVPMRRIVYPSGLAALPGVCEAVLGDLEVL